MVLYMYNHYNILCGGEWLTELFITSDKAQMPCSNSANQQTASRVYLHKLPALPFRDHKTLKLSQQVRGVVVTHGNASQATIKPE